VWAIGTGAVATPMTRRRCCAAIRDRWRSCYSGELADGVRILYGGSVQGATRGRDHGRPDVDGALVGGASLDPDGVRGHLPLPARRRQVKGPAARTAH
jgi:triosephosphate isomerase